MFLFITAWGSNKLKIIIWSPNSGLLPVLLTAVVFFVGAAFKCGPTLAETYGLKVTLLSASLGAWVVKSLAFTIVTTNLPASGSHCFSISWEGGALGGGGGAASACSYIIKYKSKVIPNYNLILKVIL